MSNQKSETNRNVIFLILIITSIVLAGIGTLEFRKTQHENKKLPIEEKKTRAEISSTGTTKDLFSRGEKILITADNNLNKLQAIKAYALGNYAQAQENFAVSLKAYSNDPETLIYLNNTKAVSQGNELTIGVSVPIGANLNVAQEILRGVAQAQNELNSSQGINGRLLEVVIVNDRNNPELAKQIATEFVKDEKILAVVGHNASDSSIAAAPIYQKGGLVMITPTSSAKDLPTLGNYIFRATPSTRALADKLADYVVNTSHKTNVAICADLEAKASKSFKNDFAWGVYERGGQINSVECNFSASDFNATEIPAQIISNGADALLIAPSLRYLNQAIDVARANRQQLPLFGSHTTYSLTTIKQGQMSVNGLILPVAWYPTSSESYFMKKAAELWGAIGSWRFAMAYDATQAIIEGLKLADSRTQLQEVLSNSQFVAKGASEPIRFMTSGDRILSGVLVTVQPGTKTGTGYDFAYLEAE